MYGALSGAVGKSGTIFFYRISKHSPRQVGPKNFSAKWAQFFPRAAMVGRAAA
jgi:hypothetical protein